MKIVGRPINRRDMPVDVTILAKSGLIGPPYPVVRGQRNLQRTADICLVLCHNKPNIDNIFSSQQARALKSDYYAKSGVTFNLPYIFEKNINAMNFKSPH